ncbi:hypothetical protein BES34_004135 [Leptospira inadai serovar Lyme]|uniref:Uncharacterized protein n=1 Tax=Leptospira inadai serovar Lyme TaxID=293084 RepID=A0ABX4YLR8_9LEPT|nr:hypothetical protein BES34_004135 [Leptospira inadai serovar Lyme]
MFRGQRTEDRGQRTEVRGQNIDERRFHVLEKDSCVQGIFPYSCNFSNIEQLLSSESARDVQGFSPAWLIFGILYFPGFPCGMRRIAEPETARSLRMQGGALRFLCISPKFYLMRGPVFPYAGRKSLECRPKSQKIGKIAGD